MFNVGDLVTLHPDYIYYNENIEYAPFTVTSEPYIVGLQIVYVTTKSPYLADELSFPIKDLIPYHPYGISKPIKGSP